MKKGVVFGEFEFPVFKGLNYLVDDNKEESQFLFVNGPNEIFSMYFENGMEKFTVPDNFTVDGEYCLLELKSSSRKIHFFCPKKWEHLNSVIWYFYVELFDAQGAIHVLPGQVRVMLDGFYSGITKKKPKFIEVLEQIRLNELCQAT